VRSVADVQQEAFLVEAKHNAEEEMLDSLVADVVCNDIYESCWPEKPNGVAVRSEPSKQAPKIKSISRGTTMTVVRAQRGPANQPGTAWAELKGGGWFPMFRDHVQGLVHCSVLEENRLRAKGEVARAARVAEEEAKEKAASDLEKWRKEGLLLIKSHTAGDYQVTFEHGVHFRDAASHYGKLVGGADYGDVISLGGDIEMAEDATVYVQRLQGDWVGIYKRGVELCHPKVQQSYIVPAGDSALTGREIEVHVDADASDDNIYADEPNIPSMSSVSIEPVLPTPPVMNSTALGVTEE
jgi:hypothetical protein